MTDFILTSVQTISGTVDQVGGKAHGLAWLASQPDVVVPEFACLTTAAYDAFISQRDPADAVEVLRRRLRHGASRFVIAAESARISAALEGVPVLREVAEVTVTAAARLLAAGHQIAVRSSATTEDLPSGAAAGLHHSQLHITDPADVLDAVHRCWVSAWSNEAIQYRVAHGLAVEGIRMGVVLQHMVNADTAGVLFTADPLTGDSSITHIEAVRGLGDRLVAGTSTPEVWRTGPAGLHRQPSQPGGGSQAAGRGGTPVLTPDEAEELAALGGRLASRRGSPLDLEWARSGGVTYLLQARPVTTATDGQVPSPKPIPKGRWTRSGFGEWFQSPLSPLFATTVLPELERATTRLLASRLGLRRRHPTWLVFGGYYYTRRDIHLTLSLLGTPIRGWAVLRSGADEWQQAARVHARAVRDLDRIPAGASPEAILDQLHRIITSNAEAWAWIVLTGAVTKFAESLFGWMVRAALKPLGHPPSAYLSGFENASVAADDALWVLAQQLRSAFTTSGSHADNSAGLPSVPSADDVRRAGGTALARWTDQYGHRLLDLDPAYESDEWREARAISVLQIYLSSQAARPRDQHRQATREREAAEAELQQYLRRRPIRRQLVSATLRLAQGYAAIRESRPFALHRGWPPRRRAALELGQRLSDRRLLDHPDDVFFVQADELAAFVTGHSNKLDLRTAIQQRRRDWLRFSLTDPPTSLNPGRLDRVLTPRRRRPRSGTTLTGRAASPGQTVAHACVLSGPSDWSRFRPGTIIVTRLTTPAWTGLLSIAGGIVTEQGGALSHAAIMAREYGVPAVVGVPDLLDHVRDGDLLEIDGAAGTVRRISHEH